MNTESTPPTTAGYAGPGHFRIRVVIAAVAVGLGAMMMRATVAEADPSTVKADCAKAGGTYSSNSTSSETCCFKDPVATVKGKSLYCKEYLGGEFVGNSVITSPPPSIPPPTNDLPIPTTPPAAAQ